MSDAMMRSLIHFAESGNPSTAEIAMAGVDACGAALRDFRRIDSKCGMRPRQMDWLAQHPPVLKNTPVPGRTTRD